MSKQQEAAPAFDWEKIVDESVDSWPEPVPLAVGHWQFKVKGGKVDRTKGRANIALQPLEPMEDVNRDEVDESAMNSALFASFNLARHEQVAQLKQFIRSMGFGELSIEAAVKALKDSIVAGRVEHSPKNDGTEGKYVNVRNLGPVAA